MADYTLMTEDEREAACPHKTWERNVEAGHWCPICLRAEAVRMRTALQAIAEIDWETEGPTLAKHALADQGKG